MRITALGHAGLKVETSNATILLDPWMSPEGAFQGAWQQFPDNSHLITDELLRPDAIVISHEHLDHVDPWFLARVAPEVPVFIPHYPSPTLTEKILAAGPRRIVEAREWETVEVVPGVSLFFVSEPPMNHDSAMVLQAEGYSLLNMNDARLFPVQLRQIRQRVGGRVDFFTLQGAGASWYPMCYGYPPEEHRVHSRKKRMSKFAYCQKVMQVLEPVVGLAFAGPPAFLDDELFHHNAEMSEGGIFPDQAQVVDWLATRGIDNTVVLLPGDAWDVSTRTKHADPQWATFSFSHRDAYLRDYAEQRRDAIQAVRARYPAPAASLWEPFRQYFTNLLALSPYFNERIAMRVGFEITGPGGGDWSVDFRPEHQGVHEGLEGCGYTYRLESRWLVPILDGRTPWEDFFLTLRFEARRNPDLYNDHLLGLLKFADREALDAVEAFESTPKSDERITVHSEGQRYSVSRYCPHAGSDLLLAGEVLPGGILRCLAHHYDFDLRSGACLTGTCPALKVDPLAAESRESDLT